MTAGGHGEQSLSFSKTAGGSRVRSEEVSISSEVSMTAKKQGVYQASVFIDYGVIEGTAVRKIRNKKTGVTVEKFCRFRRKKGFQISATFDGERIHSEPVDA